LNYNFSDDKVEIIAQPAQGNNMYKESSLVLPVASVNSEKVVQSSPTKIEIYKPGGTVVLESNVPLWIKPTEKGRVFNLVPGVEAVPVFAVFNPAQEDEVSITMRVV
jgi:hypothetical protein